MIRYRCPHCERVCESADVLHGFTVFCLGCRQAVKVPDESTIADEEPASTPKFAPPEPAPLIRTPDPASAPVPTSAPLPAPVAPRLPEPPPMKKPLPTPPFSKPAPRLTKPAPNPRLLVRLVLVALFAIILIVAGQYGLKWNRKRQAAKADLALREKRRKLQDNIREGFGPAQLKRLASRNPTWNLVPAGPIRVKGKLVVLSVTEPTDGPQGFWAGLLARWPQRIADDASLVRDLFERGKLDEIMFDLPDERWAEGVGEVDTLVGVRWRKEIAGGYNGETLVEMTPRQALPQEPHALRWHVTVLLLDRATSQLVARQEFLGPLPKSPPAGDKKFALGAKPIEDVRQWLLSAESGKLKAGAP